MQITARAAGGAVQGDDFGFILLRRGSDVRRIPYAFSVSRSSLTGASVAALKTLQSGDTRAGDDRASVYRWPTSPFSILGIFGVDPSVNDDGKEKIYSLDITKQAVNAGVVVVRPETKLDASITALLSSNQPIHPWFMGSLDENDVLGYAGIPVNVNGTLPDFSTRSALRGGVFLPPGRYYVSVDSGRDLFTGQLARRSLHAALVGQRRQAADGQGSSRRLSSGRPTIVAKVTDAKSGVDPHALQLFFGPTKQPILGRGVDVRSGDGNRSVLHSLAARSALDPGTQFMQARGVGLPGREEHQHRVRQPASEYALRGTCEPRLCTRPDDHLGHAREGQVPGGAPEAARGGERQRSDLVGGVLRRPAARSRRVQQERRAGLYELTLAHRREAAGRARASPPSRPTSARARSASEPRPVRICK